jgi:hypothetical protein
MNQTNTVMLAILVALATTTGLVTALSSVATSAHAKVNICPSSPGLTCTAGGSGQQGGGGGSHIVIDPVTGSGTSSGGVGHVGGHHFSSTESGGTKCVGSACPP